MSEGSLEETKYYLILSKDLNIIDGLIYNELYELAEEIGRLLNGFIKKLKT